MTNHGGARKGAGAKRILPKESQRIDLKLSPEDHAKLRELAKEEGVTMAQWLRLKIQNS